MFEFAIADVPLAYTVNLLKSIGIVTECISDHNDINKHNNCLNLICALNV